MQYIYVNKNYIIPEVITCEELSNALNKLYNQCYQMSKSYCVNVYVVSNDKLYFSSGEHLYSISEEQTINKVEFKNPTYDHFNTMKKFLSFDNNSDMDISIDILPINNIVLLKEETQKKEVNQLVKKEVNLEIKEEKVKSKEELEILALCEETIEIYNNELRKIKDLEHRIKILDNNEKLLLKKRQDKIFTNLSKLKNDYNTFKLIEKKLIAKPETQIPSLFALKYAYFKEHMQNQDLVNMLENIQQMNLDEILHKNEELDFQIVQLVNKYELDSKKLNVKFDHSWEELEADTFESNNSRLGS